MLSTGPCSLFRRHFHACSRRLEGVLSHVIGLYMLFSRPLGGLSIFVYILCSFTCICDAYIT